MTHRIVIRTIKILCLVSLLLSSLAMATMDSQPKSIAIILDDGPIPEYTAAFLEIFEQENIHVSFALVGEKVMERPDLAKTIAEAGHEIVNHSHSHAHPKPLSDEDLAQEVVGGQNAISKGSEVAPKWYWPPYLEFDDRMPDLFKKASIERYEPKGFVSSEDWNREVDAEAIYKRATTGVTDGTVVLFHEWREETLQQMPKIIAELKCQNCRFLTFSELANAAN